MFSFSTIELQKVKVQLEQELFERVVPFWERHSLDITYGGYFNCLDQDGSIYDTTKHIWLQGRQVWMFAKLYESVQTEQKWLDIARSGVKFLRKHAKTEGHRVYFATDRQGRGKQIQRKIFSECFYVMALNQFGKVTGELTYQREAIELLEHIWTWSKDLRLIGQVSYPGVPPNQGLAVPMILLNIFEEISGSNWSRYESEIRICINEILQHVDSDRKIVFETVGLNGEFIDSIEGRMLNPGHAIEAGWFLQHWAQKLNDQSLQNRALEMVDWSFERGWDQDFGGLYYFLDSEGCPPTPLEWNMKLWWPHTEALYAWALNYKFRRKESDWNNFMMTLNYSFNHFSDPVHGEWFGYLNREGMRTHQLKGGPYKGCFHVPRALLYTIKCLEDIGD